MKKNPVFISAFCSLLFWYSAWAAPLFENGKTQWKIQVPAAPDPVEEYAAEELRDALGKMSGAVFPIIKSDAEARENTIVIGTPATSAAVREISSRLRFNSSEIESLNVITWHGRLYLVGNVVRGSLYAVYCFLNRELGVRWLWPGKEGEFIPRKNRYNLPVLFYAYTPPFRYRSMLNTLGNQDAEIWAARNFMNASSVNLKVRSKAGFHRIYGNHMIGLTKQDRLLHPDYCGLRQGERTGPAGCWSNPGFLKLMTERVSEIIEKYQLEIINPYPADVTGRCECRKCVENKDLSSRWYLFYQKLRDELHKKYPRLRFAGLAYQEYRRPPLKFPPGLEFVEYAQYNRCYVHTLDDPACGINAKSIRELRQWCRLSPMGIYGYAFVLFHPAAYTPFWDMLANAVKTYRDMNLLHIKTEFPVSGPKTARSERIQERQRLPYYMYAQLVWNPDVNIKELVSDFCATVYGPAAQPMTEYHLAMAKAWNLQKAHYSYFLHKPDGASLHFINPELIKTAKQKFSEAKTILERLSGDDSGKTRRLSDLEIDIAAFRQWEKLYQITHEKAVTVSLPQTDSFSKAPVFEMNSRNQMHQKTELRIYYTRDALHLQITCAEKDMQNLRKGTAGHDSSAVFNGDHIEIFLDCQQGYLHFAFTPAGGTYDAFGHDTSYNPSWKPVIHMKKDCWIAEVSLPFKELGAVPVSGDQWQLIVNRNSRPEACGFPLPAYHDISAGAILYFSGKSDAERTMIWVNGSGNVPNQTVSLLKNHWNYQFFKYEDHEKIDFSKAKMILLSMRWADRNRLPLSFYREKLLPALMNGAVLVITSYGAPDLPRWFDNPALKISAELYKLSPRRRTSSISKSDFTRKPDDIREFLWKTYTPPGVFNADASQWEFLASQKLLDGRELPYLIARPWGKGLLVVSLLFTPVEILNNLLEYNKTIKR